MLYMYHMNVVKHIKVFSKSDLIKHISTIKHQKAFHFCDMLENTFKCFN